MTGFGAASVTSQGWTMKVEARSVNHKGLDVRVWAPREWAWVEPFALGVVREHAQRGRVELRVELEPDSGSGTTLVDELARRAPAPGTAVVTHGALRFGQVIRSEHGGLTALDGCSLTVRPGRLTAGPDVLRRWAPELDNLYARCGVQLTDQLTDQRRAAWSDIARRIG